MTKNTIVVATAAIAIVAIAALLTSQDNPTEQLMRVKRDYAHRLLDAVVQEDFAAVREQAFRLKTIAETSDWKAIDSPEYVRRSDAFLAATVRLVEAARERQGDAVALAYMDLTLKCVQCHRYLKNTTSTPD